MNLLTGRAVILKPIGMGEAIDIGTVVCANLIEKNNLSVKEPTPQDYFPAGEIDAN